MRVIDHAVGAGALNNSQDIQRVAELFQLARYSAVVASTSTDLEQTIRKFQHEIVGSKKPDGRIDPGGATIQALVAEARKKVFMLDRVCRQYSDQRVTEAILGEGHPKVVKGNIQKPQLISNRTTAALRLLGYCCGLKQMTITEGIRTYEMMASYFLRKITSGSSGVRGESYRHALEILKKHNNGKPYAKGSVPEEHIKTVADRMRKRCEATKTRVSYHVVSESEYATLNVIDLGYNSNPVLKGRAKARLFARLLDSFHLKNPHAEHKFIRTYYPPHYLNAVLNSPYAREIRVERAWHIEFVVAKIPTAIV